jgi:carboxypeptidase Q
MATIQKIRQEGLQDSHVMDIAFHLTDASGDRLTASPGFLRAANWAKQQLTQWGLTLTPPSTPGGILAKAGNSKSPTSPSAAPYYKPLIAFPKAWCGGTDGEKSASVLLISAKDSAGSGPL